MATESAVEAKNVAGAITSMRIDELISDLAIGIANGQTKLDQACMEIARFMSEAQVAFGKHPNSDEPDLISLMELGFTPNFYQFVDTILEVRVAVSSKFEESREYDSSDTRFQSAEAERQHEYESQQSKRDTGIRSSSSSSSSSSGSSWGWGWWGGGSGSYSSSSSSSRTDTGASSASSSRTAGASKSKSKSLALTTVDAKYASTYNYAVEASSLIKTKIVPVPPPEVFEETVQDMLKQRREWEKRMRLIDQIESILPGLITSADKIETALSQITLVNYTQSHAQDHENELLKLQENYGALTTELWTIIASVEDRRVMDDSLGRSLSGMNQLVSLFKSDDTLPAPEAKKLLKEIGEYLNRFKTRTDELFNRLFPPEVPEESQGATENQQTEGQTA